MEMEKVLVYIWQEVQKKNLNKNYNERQDNPNSIYSHSNHKFDMV